MAYIALCAYSTLFKIRVLNLYYLAPHHQTDEYSLIFSGMMLCRLTPPMCLNFLSLIHMDSHVIKERTKETHYTQVSHYMNLLLFIYLMFFNIRFRVNISLKIFFLFFRLWGTWMSSLL